MIRTHSGSLAAGGLNWDSLPLKLFAGGNANFWDPADIDFSRDRADWEELADDERHLATRLCAQFIAGEEAVTEDIQPFMAAMRAEGRLGDEMYLDPVRLRRGQTHPGVPAVARCRRDRPTTCTATSTSSRPTGRSCYQELPDASAALTTDPPPAAPVRASSDLQPRRRGHAGADRLLCLEPDLRGARHPARHAGADPAHRRRRATPHGVGHLHLPAPCRRRRRQLDGLRDTAERAHPAGAAG